MEVGKVTLEGHDWLLSEEKEENNGDKWEEWNGIDGRDIEELRLRG